MIKDTQTVSISTPIADEGTETTAVINIPRALALDVQAKLVLDTGTISGNIVVEVITTDGTNDYLPAEDDDNRTITILSDKLTASSTVYYSKGVDRIAGASNIKLKITNNSGVSLTTGTAFELGVLKY